MKYLLGLNGEPIEDRVSSTFCGVGMIRGEYLCKKLGEYITRSDTQDYIQNYLKHVAALFHPDPVWYRTIEMVAEEINILDGCDEIIDQTNSIKSPLLGYRGIRRGMRLKETFKLELRIVSEVAREHRNIHVLIPFVYDVSEIAFARSCLDEVGFHNNIGMMAEIPSAIVLLDEFIGCGVQHVVVGLNDLTSLVLGSHRACSTYSLLHPAVRYFVEHARAVTKRYGIPLALAGYLSDEVMDYAVDVGCDYIVVHYDAIPQLFGAEFSDLPGLGDFRELKQRIRKCVRTRAIETAVSELKRFHGHDS